MRSGVVNTQIIDLLNRFLQRESSNANDAAKAAVTKKSYGGPNE